MSGTIKKTCVAGVLFILLCGATSTATILSEGFEGSFPPAGWTQNSVDQKTTRAHSGSYSAYFSAGTDYLITPALHNAQTLTCWTYTTSSDPDILVETSASASGPWTAVTGSPFSGNTGQWNERVIALSASGTVYVKFNKNGSGSLYIDDVTAQDGGNPVNNAPVLAAIGNQTVTLSNALNFAVTASDVDNDLITLSASNLPPGAVFNTVTNAGSVSNNFSWAVAAPTGTYTTTFYADDGTTNDFEAITITVSNAPIVNVAPVLAPIGSQTVTNGQTLTFQVNASDANNDPLTYTASNLPPGAVFSTHTIPPQFSWSPAGPVGVTTSRFTVADGTTNDFENVVITVVPVPNAPPILAPIGSKSLTVGDSLNFTVSATDANGENITLSASNLPPGAVFNTVTNAGTVSNSFSWAVAAPVGVYTPTFTADDGTTHVSETITITITKPPSLMITEVADPAGTGGGDYRFVELYNSGSAPVILEGGSWFLSKQVNGGSWTDTPLAGTIPAGETFVVAYSASKFQEAYGFPPDESDSNISGTGDDAYFLFSGGNHTTGTLVDIYGEFDTDGTDTAWEYTDGRAMRNSTASGPSTSWIASEWTITTGATTNDMNPGAAYNVPPVLSPIGSQGGLEGRTISFSVSASDLTDTDPVVITNSALPPGAVFTGGTFIWSNAAPAGVYSVTFTATDKDGSDDETVTITVIEQPRLILSEIADPSGTGADVYRFVEIYNASTGTVDLAANHWYLSRQNNGGSSWADIPLTATLLPGQTHVLAKSRDDFYAAYGFYPDQEDSGIDGNGNDTYCLFYGGNHYAGILIDIYGEIGTDGLGTDWDYTDSRTERKDGVVNPNTEWTEDEWTITSGATVNSMTPGQHGPLPEIVLPASLFVFSGDSFDFSVGASNRVDAADKVTLTATNLPAGASFSGETGIGSASGRFIWNSPPDGTYSVLFTAAGKNGTAEESATLVVSDHTTLQEWFYRWKGRDQIYKLANGQFWQQTSSETYGNYGLYRPEVTIEKQSSTYRMRIPDVIGSVEVQPLSNTVETRIAGTFSGYAEGNIVKLGNGTWWRQTSNEGSVRNQTLLDVLLWQDNGGGGMFIEGEDDPISVEPIAVTESDVTGLYTSFSMGRDKIYTLADGTTWKQTSSSDSLTTSDTDITAWRWTEDGAVWIRFVDSSNLEVGTCRVEASGAPANPAIISRIDGYFRGWKGQRVFMLQNGEFWQQTTPTTVEQTLYNPLVVLTNIQATGTWQMRVDGALPPAYVEVKQRTDVTRLSIDGWFYGFQSGNFFSLSDGSWWRQTSSEILAYSRYRPEILLYGGTRVEMPDLGISIGAEPLAVQSESLVTNAFTGLHYANVYILADGQSWMQLSFENIGSSAIDPATMLWSENGQTNLLMRNSIDRTIGSCTVADPWGDADGDGILNMHELIAGTSLFDRNDYFMITLGSPDPDGRAVLRWVPASGRTYLIEWTPSLLEPFQPLETLTDWTQDRWTDTINPPGSGGFYRVRARLAD